MLHFPPKPFISHSVPILPLSFLGSTPLRNLTVPKFIHHQPVHGFFHLPRSRKFPVNFSSVNQPASVDDDDIGMELGRFLGLLPEVMRDRILEHPELRDLVEVVLDLGRKPLARFPSGDIELSDSPITFQDIEFATSQVGDFAIDNRAGISRTLHRISAVRNRRGDIIGLTCRVGRAVTGSADLLQGLVKDGASLLLIGPPGVGKTTIIREIARMLADDYKKRVMIVDTSNEIGGDGDIPHAGIGNARRMQVPDSDMQHKVLIEAVENHMPQVIVIDEIGTKLEAAAATTISQRGIQLVATAHGITIGNLVMNPSLDMLVGGIQSVTLGDEEASRRGRQKTVLERKGPATFKSAVELISKTELRVHRNLEATVDIILAGRSPQYEVRKRNRQSPEGSTEVEYVSSTNGDASYYELRHEVSSAPVDERNDQLDVLLKCNTVTQTSEAEAPIRVFIHGISETTVMQGIKKLRLNHAVQLIANVSEADAVLAPQSKFKRNPQLRAVVDSHGIPVYATKTGSLVQVMKAIRSVMDDHEDKQREFQLGDESSLSEKTDALEEARLAVEHVVIRKGEPVELLPRALDILLLQIKLAQSYHLQTEILGRDLEDKRLRILPFLSKAQSNKCSEDDEVEYTAECGLHDFLGSSGESKGPPRRLPLLPDYPYEQPVAGKARGIMS